MKLDVGCGKHKRADIGIDVSRNSQADVIADAQHLPFQNDIFDTVLSHHMIEHLQKPELAINEMVRVSKAKVEIVCPHRFGHYAKITSDHIKFFNKRWFTQLARKLNVKERVRTTFTPAFYFGVLGLFMRPSELIVEYRTHKTEEEPKVSEKAKQYFVSCIASEPKTPQKVTLD